MAIKNNNVFNEINAYKYDLVEIDEEFEKEIISQIPSGLNKLEIAMYVYIKLCKTFTYDEEYFLHLMGTISKRDMSDLRHTELSNLSKINKNNNSVVCWEFVIIYGKILKDLGIDSYVYDTLIFDDKPSDIVDEEEYFQQRYGKWHPTFGIRIDSTFIDVNVSAWYGDLSLAKNNYAVRNIRCIDETVEEKNAISNAIKKAYSFLAPNEPIKSSDFDACVEEYEKNNANKTQVSVDEKIEILLEKIQEPTLTGMDMLDYILLLRILIFSQKEREDNFKAIMVSGDPLENGTHRPIIIFTLNDTSISNNPEKNNYYIYNHEKMIMPIDREELQAGFLDNRFIYFRDGSRISGIKER